MNDCNDLYSLVYPRAKSVVICGDIHGDFNHLVFKLCVQYQMKDTVLIVAGDCGFGFEKKEYYEMIVKRNTKRMSNANNWIVFVRGNHDNPAYFDGKSFNHKRFVAVSDYALINVCSHTILCVGGAISIDREFRKAQNEKRRIYHETSNTEDIAFRKNIYWENERPYIDDDILNKIKNRYKIDTIITHTAPSFCELITKGALTSWAENDYLLLQDVEQERKIIDMLHYRLINDGHPLSHWYYGHFHQSWRSSINNIMFIMLDILEFATLY